LFKGSKYLLLIINILFITYSCKYERQISDKKYINEVGYILKCPPNSKGLIVLFPKFYNSITKTDLETKIDEKYFSNGYASLIIDFKSDFFLDKKDFIKIYDLIKYILSVNNISRDRLIIGGFSTGGTIALSYAIWIKKFKKAIIPSSIIVGDSPVDFEAFYINKKNVINKNFNARSVDEAKFIVKYLDEKIGNPTLNLNNYYTYSPYIHSNFKNSNIRYLKDYNIIFFSEPDLIWYKNTIGYEFEDLNSFQISKFQNELKKISSKRIDFIKTHNKGFINSEKQPHSWSIIDPDKLFEWTSENFIYNQ
jgi:hypothetical protein